MNEQQKALQVVLGAMAASNNGPEGFMAFYEVIFGQPAPPHARDWIEQLFYSRENGRGVVIEAFRGSTKTTTLTIAFTAFQIGHNPTWASLLIQVGDDIANDNTQQIADIIENNPGWQLAFPDIVPDYTRGWGAAGYEVKRTDIPYGEWRKMNAARKDPTLLGVGYKSRAIIGKHPDLLVVDDIHDENNTSSYRELVAVIKRLTATIIPTMMEHTWAIYVGTPWTEDDTLAYIKGTGLYDAMSTPVLRPAEDGEAEFEGERVALTWPSMFPIEVIQEKRQLVGEVEFARMYQLSLEKAKVTGFKFFSFPNEQISTDWLHVHGVDYASIITERQASSRNRSYFALAYVAKLPAGGAVVVDGVRTRCTQQQAEDYIKRAQNMFPHVRTTVVEADGKGEEFVAILHRNPDIVFQPEKTGGKGKKERLERQMSPWFENGHVRISDADTPFLQVLRKEMQDYPSGTNDALDAVYWALRGMPEVLQVNRSMETKERRRRRRSRSNPWLALGRI